MDAKHGNQARWLVGLAQERGPLHLAQDEIATRAQEAVTFARDNAVEREAVADMRQVMTDALRRNLGLTTHDAVTSEIRLRQERREFIDIMREHRSPEATTQRMLKMEQENIQTVMDGKGSSPAVVRAARVKDVVANSAQNNQLKLNANQQSAIETILSSEDQIVGLQGGAGTGKTTVLSVLREATENEGYQVRGFAPTTRAAKQLAESGIETETLQKFLRRRQEPTTSKRLLILDESSLASTKQLHKFFGCLEAEDKVLLVGDVRQHQAVEAGSPFEQLQKHGMPTAQLNEIVRQRDPELKQTVAKLSVRQIREAVAELESRGKVIEITDERERLKAIAQDYSRNPTNTLVISPANRERTQLNSLIHQQLQREGKISRDDHQMKVYVNRQDMTGVERTFASAYRPNEDIIRYNRASKIYKVKPGDYASVIGVNHERNELTVRFPNGRTLTYDPTRLSGVSVYNKAERSFAEGDRIQFRAPFPEKRIVNGELGTINKIEPEHLRVALDSGREVTFDPQQFRHIDHGYAVTSHSSQGLTVDRVLINADTQESLRLLNDRMAYVAVSRAREEALIYTDSMQNLRESLNRATNKEMALEATNSKSRDLQQDRDGLTDDHLIAHEQTHNDHGMNQNSAQIDPAQAKAAELAVESEGQELAAFLI
jgi:ATP-dependent exoDNAse (exonuclease V) alpha subunit